MLWQIDVSVNSFDCYPSSDRVWLDIVEASSDYLPTIQRRLDEVDRQGLHFDLCLYNAGMDPFENCPTGGMRGITREVLADRERMVFRLVPGPTTACRFRAWPAGILDLIWTRTDWSDCIA